MPDQITKEPPVTEAPRDPRLPSKGYSAFVLSLLIVVYIFNFIDRQILSILNEAIKADLGLSDAQMGFLYGTSFAVFYAIFGLPLARLADTWKRTNLIGIGLGFWSLMTVLSGTSKSFGSLAAYRVGVAVGESSATPAVFSMLADMFSKAIRGTVIAIYSSGIFLGAGVGIVIGGTVVEMWGVAYPDVTLAPFGLKGWQVAFMVVGLPGLLLAPVIMMLREPPRGLIDGVETTITESPVTAFKESLFSVLPPFSLFVLYGTGQRIQVLYNLIALAAIAVVFSLAAVVTNNIPQWAAFGLGMYCAFSWAQVTRLKDLVTFQVIFSSKAMLFAMPGFAFISFVSYGIGYWAPPYFLRNWPELGAAEAGQILGTLAAVGGGIGVISGGMLADYFRTKFAAGRLYLGIGSALLSLPAIFIFLTTDNLQVAYVSNFFAQVLSPMWIGAGVSTISDLCLPRMRAVGSAFYLLIITFIGLALGPYFIGTLSDIFVVSGESSAIALRYASMIGALFIFVAVILLFLASLWLKQDEASLIDRARAAGEKI